MNRIILIGNGFDLAHDLETNYKHFIDNLWRNIINEFRDIRNYKNDVFENNFIYIKLSLPIYTQPLQAINSYSDFKTFLKENVLSNGFPMFIEFKNNFLKTIMDKLHLEKWVDIENEYYEALKDCIKQKESIDKLNEDFNQIKDALIRYLEGINDNLENYTLDFPHENIVKTIFSDFNMNDFIEAYIDKKTKMEYEKIPNFELNSFSPKEILFLNFNYTSTELYYSKYYKDRYSELKNPQTEIIEPIYIHGKLEKENNPIIFGFGDEIDESYKSIENLNDNRYLENIKSIKYFETGNYKRLLSFINSDDYQIFIFGHSCGNSDRTLLNTLFEHENCVSIKVFYHKKEDGTDNYSDIVRNISRHFTNKAVMRDKVVNKKDCNSLIR
ncbi:hypothetical protein FACS189426_15860 [Bacteroidia bacterium]|nr:hypothetical protein FACS189426_15860 [Bacteroidia bacterium]